MPGRLFAFVRVQNPEALKSAVKSINRERTVPMLYQRLICTAPRRGWLALLFDGEQVDYYLLRSLSKQLATESFGLMLSGIQVSYRYFVNGKTKGAYESHLELKIADRLRRLLVTQNVSELDLAEPAEGFVLYLYRQYTYINTWEQPPVQQNIPPFVTNVYKANIHSLKNLLRPEIDARYVAEVLSPGYSPEAVIERLVNALQLPYLSPADEIVYPYAADPALKRSLSGAAILDPRRWPASQPLPAGWEILTNKDWT